MNDTDTCACGHVRDEHDTECTIDGCLCVYFEDAGDDEKEDGTNG